MSTVLVISSQVIRGYVGGTASRIALEALGHQVWLARTVLLSNHPAHPHVARETILPESIRRFMLALDENGWLYDIDAILTGYLPSADHVAEAVHAIMMVQAERNGVCILCDPILGDDPGGLYIDEEAATAIRNRFVPVADFITPNRFELEWLTGKPVKSLPQALEAGQGLVQKYGAVVLASALPGDYAAAGVQNVLDANRGADDLPLQLLRRHWADAKPLRTQEYFAC